MKEKTIKFLKYIGNLMLIALFFSLPYIYSWYTGGELTSAESCTSHYMNGDYDLNVLKERCPRLEKQYLIEQINIRYENSLGKEKEWKDKLILEVNTYF